MNWLQDLTTKRLRPDGASRFAPAGDDVTRSRGGSDVIETDHIMQAGHEELDEVGILGVDGDSDIGLLHAQCVQLQVAATGDRQHGFECIKDGRLLKREGEGVHTRQLIAGLLE